MAKKSKSVSDVKASDKDTAKTSEKANKGKKKVSLGSKIVKYFRDLKGEFNKVVWPSKKQVFNNTLVVLTTMVVAGLFVGGLDTGMYKLLQLLMKINGAE